MAHGGLLAGRAFKAMGVECIFTLSGGHIMPIYAGCQEQGIDIARRTVSKYREREGVAPARGSLALRTDWFKTG